MQSPNVPMNQQLNGVGMLTWPDFVAATRDALFPATSRGSGGSTMATTAAASTRPSDDPSNAADGSTNGAASPKNRTSGGKPGGALVDLTGALDALVRFLDDAGASVAAVLADPAATDDLFDAGMLSSSPDGSGGRLSAVDGERDWASMRAQDLRVSARVDWTLLVHLVAVLDLHMPDLHELRGAARVSRRSTAGDEAETGAVAAAEAPLLPAPKETKAAVKRLFAADGAAHVLSSGLDTASTRTSKTVGIADEDATETLPAEDAETALSVARHLCALVVATSLRAKLCLLQPDRKTVAVSSCPEPSPATVDAAVLCALDAPLGRDCSGKKDTFGALEQYVQRLLETRLVPFVTTTLRQRVVTAQDVFAADVIAKWPVVAGFLKPVASSIVDGENAPSQTAPVPDATKSAFRRAHKALVGASCFRVSGSGGDSTACTLPSHIADAYKVLRSSKRRSDGPIIGAEAVDGVTRCDGAGTSGAEAADSSNRTPEQPKPSSSPAPPASTTELVRMPSAAQLSRTTSTATAPSQQQQPGGNGTVAPVSRHGSGLGAPSRPSGLLQSTLNRPGGAARLNRLRPTALTATAATSQQHGFLTCRSPNVGAAAKPPPALQAAGGGYRSGPSSLCTSPVMPVPSPPPGADFTTARIPVTRTGPGLTTSSAAASPVARTAGFPANPPSAAGGGGGGPAPVRVLAGRSPSPPRRARE